MPFFEDTKTPEENDLLESIDNGEWESAPNKADLMQELKKLLRAL